MAKKVNYGDSYTHRLTLRLSDKHMEFLGRISEILGITPSEYLRMVINTGMVSMGDKLEDIKSGKVVAEVMGKGAGTSYENVKANIDDKL